MNSDVVSTIKRRIKSVPVLGPAAMSAKAWVSRSVFPGSARYWERWYASGGSSGPGSFGQLAGFKAEVVNAFVESHPASAPPTTGAPGSSTVRLPDGHDTNDNAADFSVSASPTPGSSNH